MGWLGFDAFNVENEAYKDVLTITARGARRVHGEPEPGAAPTHHHYYYGPVIDTVIAAKIQDSFNTVVNAPVSEDLKDALQAVADQVGKTLEAMTAARNRKRRS